MSISKMKPASVTNALLCMLIGFALCLPPTVDAMTAKETTRLKIQYYRMFARLIESQFQSYQTIFRNDILLLSNMPLMKEFTALFDENAENAEDVFIAVQKRMQEMFYEVLLLKPYYFQIRIIGDANNGRELVRVDRIGDSIIIIPDSKLQSKGRRDYYFKTMQQPPNSIYFSDVNLNQEWNKIVVPYQPVVRISRVLTNAEGHKIGILIFNIDFDKLLQPMISGFSEDINFSLVNAYGDYLYHRDESKRFGFDLGNNYSVFTDYQKSETFFDFKNNSGELVLPSGNDNSLTYLRKMYLGNTGNFIVVLLEE